MNAGPFHVKNSMDPSLELVNEKCLLQCLLQADAVLQRVAAVTIGADQCKALLAHFIAADSKFAAAKVGAGYGCPDC